MKIQRLKEQARRYEQHEEWERALQVYVQVLQSDEVAEVDFPLYNRAGDLHLRMGRPARAVDFYLQAADRYADVGLYNNAIALCNKALRYFPERPDIYRRLAECNAAQGFAIEARRWVAEYAERVLQTQGVEEATRALSEVADALNDPDVRALLGRRLAIRGRAKPAVKQLRLAYAAWIDAGRVPEAAKLRDEILEIDSSIELPPLPVTETAAAEDDTGEDETGDPDRASSDGMASEAAGQPEPTEDDVDGPDPAAEPERDDEPRALAPEPEPVADEELSVSEAAVEPEDEEEDAGAATQEPERDEDLRAEAASMEPADEEDALAPAVAAEPKGIEDPLVAEQLVDEAAGDPPATDRVPHAADDDSSILDGFEYDEPPPSDEPEWRLAPDDTDADPPSGPEAPGGQTGAAEPGEEKAEPPEAGPDPLAKPESDSLRNRVLARLRRSVREPELLPEPEPEPMTPLEESAEEEAAGASAAPAEPEPTGLDDLGIDPYLGIKLHALDSLEFPELGEISLDGSFEAGLSADPGRPPPGGPAVPRQDDAEPAEIEPDPSLPLLEFGDDDLVWDPVAATTSSTDIDAALERAESAVARGDRGGAARLLSRLADRLVQGDRHEEAIRAVERLAALRPDDLRLHQRWVELAARTAELPLLVQAYLALAAALARQGANEKAHLVYQRVLDLDPGNPVAREAHAGRAAEGVGPRSEAASAPPARPAPPDRRAAGAAGRSRPGAGAGGAAGPPKKPAGGASASQEEHEFAAMLAEFKERVNEELGEGDWASRYDLGIAFREMGLLDDAIAEFQASLRGGKQHAKVYEQLGQCFMAKGQHTVAAQILARGVRIATGEGNETLGLHYHLGRCYEALGRRAEAKEAFGRVVRANPRFADAEQRFARL